MNEEETMLEAVLARPAVAGPRKTYLAWLDERGFRAEYLRLLMSGLEEPTTAPAGGAVREKLRQLRPRIDPAWADRVDRSRLATNALYQSDPVPQGWPYLRFYSDGTVALGCSHNTPAEMWRLSDPAISAGVFIRTPFRLFVDEISFMLPYDPPAALKNEWNVLMEKMVEQAMKEQFDFIAADAAVREYQDSLRKTMNRIRLRGVVGSRVLCLESRSEFAERLIGMTTYRLVEIPPE